MPTEQCAILQTVFPVLTTEMVRFLSTTAYAMLFPYIVLAAAHILPRLPSIAGTDDIVARSTCQGQSYSYSI